ALATRSVQPGWIHHSDRGSQYASGAHVEAVETAGGRVSMSRKGRPGDNPKAESLFATLKCEHVYRTEYEDLDDAREQLAEFVDRYNSVRRHSALRYQSPDRFEAAVAAAPRASGGDRRRRRAKTAVASPRHRRHQDTRREAKTADEPDHHTADPSTSSPGRHPTK
ncbi:MAG: transposase, partial [Armatimonadia bacterium]|nr:transposase [Armatimonadia bacterium]